ncbi:MAG: DUF4412 domain-containing protein [Gemmatimonadota bacterium]
MLRAKLGLAAMCLLVTNSSQLAAQRFDGVMQFVLYGDKEDAPDTITVMTKGSKMRMEGMGSSGGAMIMDGTSRLIILPDQKQYMEMPANLGDRIASKESARHHGIAVKTGKTERVAGISCDDWHYKGTDKDGKPEEGDVCMAKGAGLMINRLAGGMMDHVFGEGGKEFNEAMNNGGGLMKVTDNGKLAFVAIRAQSSSVPDAMFAPPAGYSKMEMPQMGKPHKP